MSGQGRVPDHGAAAQEMGGCRPYGQTLPIGEQPKTIPGSMLTRSHWNRLHVSADTEQECLWVGTDHH